MTTRAPARSASRAESSSESLSATTTSPSTPIVASAASASLTQRSMFSASLRQGMTTDTSGPSPSSRSNA